jgi:hypothetical protein
MKRLTAPFRGQHPRNILPHMLCCYIGAEDDLGVASEATTLKCVLEDQYNFHTDTYLIPSVDAEQLLVQRIFEFKKAHASPEKSPHRLLWRTRRAG